MKSAAACDIPAVYYKSCVCGAFSNSETAATFTSGQATGHSWGKPAWSWSADNTAATVKFICENDSTHIREPQVSMEKQITPATCTKEGKTVYTASVTFEGNLYTDSRSIPIDALGHTVSRVKAKAPTATEAGNIEYWHCTECDKYFSDEALTKEIQKADTVLPATGAAAEPTSEPATKPADTTSPQTGDNSDMILWIALLFIAGGAVTALTIVNKKGRGNVKQ